MQLGFQFAALAAVLAGLAIGPLSYGATETWSLTLLQYLAAGAGALWILSGSARPALLILPGLVAALGLIQLVPLPDWLLAVVGPLAHDATEDARSLGVAGLLGCASVDPGQTLAALRQLFLMAMLVVLVSDLARNRVFRVAIVVTIVAVGLLVLSLGIRFHGGPDYLVMDSHDLSGTVHPWKNPLLRPSHTAGYGFTDVVNVGKVSYVVNWHYCCGSPVGPFLVRNHFAAFMNMVVPVALGLIVWMAGNARPTRWLAVPIAIGVACAALITIGPVARSRAGMASLVVGILVFFCLSFAPRISRRTLAGLVAGLAACLALTAFAYLLVQTGKAPDWLAALETKVLQGATSSALGRLNAWKAAAAMFMASPLLGTGLGSYGHLFPLFKTTADNWYYAHNEYAQFVAETGCAGLAAAVVALGWAVRRVCSGWGGLSGPAQRAMAAGAAGGLAGLGVHCIFDWNVHVPANAFAAAVLLGLLLAMVPREPSCATPTPDTPRRRTLRWLAPLAALLAIGLCAEAARREAMADRLAAPLRRAVNDQRILDREQSKSIKMEVLRAAELDPQRKADLLTKIPDAEKAAALVPLEAGYCEAVAQGYLHLSQGRKSPELGLAAEWFRRALRACPANRSVRNTVEQIDSLLDK